MSVHAPYAFVPLSKWVHIPEWGKPEWSDLVTHDVPFADGVCGSFEIEVQALTPILVGGPRKASQVERKERDAQGRARNVPGSGSSASVWPTLRSDGRMLIPGSAFQGCIRNLVEIAAFGRMRSVDVDRRFGLRDLKPSAKPFYQDRLSPTVNGVPTSKVKAGWLRKTPSGLELHPCEWAKIEVQTLPPRSRPDGPDEVAQSIQALLGADFRGDRWQVRGALAPENGTGSRYDLFPRGFNLTRTLNVDDRALPFAHPRVNNANFAIAYRRVWMDALPDKTSARKGNIVLTGVPGPSKHMEFFFFAEVERKPLRGKNVEEAFNRFLELHEPSDGTRISASWRFYRDSGYPGPDPFGQTGPFDGGPRQISGAVPVFYLEEAGEIAGIGLASMFKLPHRSTVRELIQNTSAEHLASAEAGGDPVGYDLASLLFGEAAGGAIGLRRRASFDAAVSSEAIQLIELGEQVLSSPKPGYHPAYIRQPQANPLAAVLERGSSYASYTALRANQLGNGPYKREHEFPEIAGRKVYPADTPSRRTADVNAENARVRSRVAAVAEGMEPAGAHMKTRLHAATAGSTFRTTVRFHNLRRVELGALLWALTLGDGAALAGTWSKRNHRLGLGKPLGLGEVKFRVLPETVVLSDAALTGDTTLETAANEFINYIEKSFRNAPGRVGAGTWKSSEQIRILLDVSDPELGADDPRYPLRYMSPAEHTMAKGGGNNAPAFLPRYITQEHCGAFEHKSFPRDAPIELAPLDSPILPPLIDARVRLGRRLGAIVGYRDHPRSPWCVILDDKTRGWYPAEAFVVIAPVH